MERDNKLRIAYSGIKGAFAANAAERIFPGEEFITYESFDEAFAAVTDGICDYGVLPLENSYAGDVIQVLDLLYFGTLYITGIYEMPVVHNLLGVKGADINDIKEVISHPQALSQCDDFIKQHGLNRIAASNTAVAAHEVADKNDPCLAAIAGRETARLYGLDIIAENINDSPDNTTRFVVVSRKREPLGAKKEAFSIMLTVKDEARALARSLDTIGYYGFNMRCVKSRPSKKIPWSYYFYIECIGDADSEKGKKMASILSEECEYFRLLGCYENDIIINE